MGRNRRSQQPPELEFRGWCVQIHGRGQDLEAHGPARHAGDRAHCDRPVDPDIVYVAALGHLWGPNKERGLYKTVDGGLTWTNTMFINEDTGFSDLVMDPSNRHVLYAAAYMRRRTAFGFAGGGIHSGIFKTIDGGRTWKKLTDGLPAGITGRIGLDISRKDPAVLYATVENRNGGIFRSLDFGETWQKVNSQNPRPMYYSQIRVDPDDSNRIYVLGSSFLVSTDGGKTFADPDTGKPGSNTSMTPTYDIGVHGDHHALWIDPKDSNHLVLGGDGGLYLSYDGSVHWTKVNNFPIGQFYAVAADMNKPYYIYGGMQDTHSWRGPSATRHQIGILNSDWSQIDFGDGMFPQVDPTDANTVYAQANDGAIIRFNAATGDRKSIKPYPKAGEPPYRFNWTAPLQISPHNSKTIYLGRQSRLQINGPWRNLDCRRGFDESPGQGQAAVLVLRRAAHAGRDPVTERRCFGVGYHLGAGRIAGVGPGNLGRYRRWQPPGIAR